MSFNANGIRAAARKGFYDWLPSQEADFVCLQEIKAQPEQLRAAEYAPEGYHRFYEAGERKGHSGVAILSRREPDRLIHGFGSAEFDREGRYLEAQFGKLSIVSVYVPSGTSRPERLQAKFRFMAEFGEHLRKLARRRRDYVICGDWNIAHKEIDLENWKGNQKNSGFLPEERAWLDEVFGDIGFVDAFREVNRSPGEYSWWTQRVPTARERNVGWRLDYHVVSKRMRERVERAWVYRDQAFSDHAPVLLDYA